MTPESIIRAKRQRRRVLVAALMLMAAGLFAAAGVTARDTVPPNSQLQRVFPPPESGTLAVSASSQAPPRRQMPIPVRISIPAIGLSARVIPLGLNRDRTVEVPTNFSDTGWFRPGPEPGERGAAVILGHVDSRRGPAVFYRLRALRRGDVIRIYLRNGSRIRFIVTGAKAVPKTRFPTKLVYAKTGGPGLRLITCGGRFDSSTGHYVDNYIVFAKLLTRR